MLVDVVNDKYDIGFRYKIGTYFDKRELDNSVVRGRRYEDVNFYCKVGIIFNKREEWCIWNSVYKYE